MGEYAKKECYYCNILRPVPEMERRAVDKHHDGDKIYKWTCKDKEACHNPDYYIQQKKIKDDIAAHEKYLDSLVNKIFRGLPSDLEKNVNSINEVLSIKDLKNHLPINKNYRDLLGIPVIKNDNINFKTKTISEDYLSNIKKDLTRLKDFENIKQISRFMIFLKSFYLSLKISLGALIILVILAGIKLLDPLGNIVLLIWLGFIIFSPYFVIKKNKKEILASTKFKQDISKLIKNMEIIISYHQKNLNLIINEKVKQYPDYFK